MPELDIQFAAQFTAQSIHDLGNARTKRFKVIRQLSERLQPVTKHPQQRNCCVVSRNFHVALVAVLVILMQWPDVHLPLRFLTGFRVVDSAEYTGVFRSLRHATCQGMEKKTLLDGAGQYRWQLSSRLPTVEASKHLLQACHKDHQAGFAGPLMSADAMSRIYPNGWAPVERFDLPQVKADGTVKHRPIDNARRSGHNATAVAVEQLDLCSAIQPVVHVQALAAALQSNPGVVRHGEVCKWNQGERTFPTLIGMCLWTRKTSMLTLLRCTTMTFLPGNTNRSLGICSAWQRLF